MKFTENGVVRTLGQQGLWMTAGAVKYSQSALDVEACSSATHAVVPDGNMDIPVALRLKLQNQMITEIETIAVRPGDYKLGGTTYASNTARDDLRQHHRHVGDASRPVSGTRAPS